MSADKAIPKCLPAIAEVVAHQSKMLYCTQAPHPRAISVAELRQMFNDLCENEISSETDSLPVSHCHDATKNDGDIRSALRNAVHDAVQEHLLTDEFEQIKYAPSQSSSIHIAIRSGADGYEPTARSVVLVCGSAFVMSEARVELGVVEPCDGDIFGSEQKDKKK